MQESVLIATVLQFMVSHACSYKCLPQFIEVLNSAGFLLHAVVGHSCHELVLAKSISCQREYYM